MSKVADRCAYCEQLFNGERTREHIIPKWFHKTSSGNGITFNERSLNKIDQGEVVIKDVCRKCNNGPLSKLDSYGESLYQTFFSKYVYGGERIVFQYDYDNLAKWLLKISFNSARANSSSPLVLAQYKKVLIEDLPIPSEIMVFLTIVSPSVAISEQEVRIANRFECNTVDPDYFRVGVLSHRKLNRIYWAARAVTIQSFRFNLFVPDLNDADLDKDSNLILDAMSEMGATLLTRKGRITTNTPSTEAVSDFSYQLANNPSAWRKYHDSYSEDEEEAEREKIISAVLQQKVSTALFIIDRADIEARQFESVVAALNFHIANRENLLKFFGRVEISIHGYDNDPRELYEIPEVKIYLKELNQLFPYWLVLQIGSGAWLRILYFCLTDARREGHQMHLNSALDEDIFNGWFMGLNEITDLYAVSIK